MQERGQTTLGHNRVRSGFNPSGDGMSPTKKREGIEGKYEMVRVEWEDSARLGRWRSLEEVEKETPCLIMTVGYLLRDDAVCMTVVGTIGMEEHPDVDGGFVIPRSAVRKVERFYTAGQPERLEGPPEAGEELTLGVVGTEVFGTPGMGKVEPLVVERKAESVLEGVMRRVGLGGRP